MFHGKVPIPLLPIDLPADTQTSPNLQIFPIIIPRLFKSLDSDPQSRLTKQIMLSNISGPEYCNKIENIQFNSIWKINEHFSAEVTKHAIIKETSYQNCFFNDNYEIFE